MTYYTENPEDATRKLLLLINEFSKVAGYKISAQQFLAFLYTSNKRSERENKETISFITATKRIKYLGINLPKEAKTVPWEDYKIPMKEIKEDTNRWREIQCSWIGRINIVKTTIITQSKLQIQCNPYQITNGIFHRIKTKTLQFVWKQNRSQIVKAILRKKSEVGGIRLPDFRLYYKVTVIKTVWYWHKNRPIDQWTGEKAQR